ncbi:MAG: hypothetical protein AAB481_02400 [Patescibacteria group bacterium]
MKATKRQHKRSIHLNTVKPIISFLIVLVAFSLFMLFNTYKNSILASGSFNSYLLLTTVAMGLLVALLFLVNPSSK